MQNMAGTPAPRLYVKARHLGYKRSQRNQDPSCSLLSLENVTTSADAKWYLGKRVAFSYRATKADAKTGSKVRTTWGKITRVHGNTGTVRATFKKNLPPSSFGSTLRVMLYPSSV